MDLEHDLSRMLEESVVGLTPPLPAILAEADRRGRRLRRRRRLQIAAATVAVAALAGTVAAFGLRPVAAPPAADPRPAPSDSREPTPVTGAGLLAVLTELLPDGRISQPVPAQGEEPGEFAGLTVDYDDGLSPVTVELSLHARATGAASAPCRPGIGGGNGNGEQRPYGAEPARCNTVGFPDGSTGWSTVSTADANGLYSDSVDLTRPDGSELLIRVYNGRHGLSGDEESRSVRSRPPLTSDQLTALARSPRWRFQVPDRPTAAVPGTPSPGNS
ncbi:hypothetical protein [Saccharothrix sp. ST-888]|uniref:hypothetical protein n=1 Tax=Saccharothrix sp. ST-888 TaxID=1427391 RepID=UPI0005ECE319|nr:hypothetical protein [Saccharothrix sp. ST-888]KJK59098.1 hypothetical protein UK12_05910 [Saccharothrix sp. ST-888]